jgi:EF-P beta-lysylation protein EpmB
MTEPAEQAHDAPPTELNWRTTLSRACSRDDTLLSALQLAPGISEPDPAFPLRVPRGFINRIQPGNPDDPLLRQILPTSAESIPVEGYSADPVGDLDSLIAPGVLQKYSGRALLITTGACAIHCRYCFRRAYPYASASLSRSEFKAAFDALEADRKIEEIILSGGDPLTLPNEKLATLIDASARITHIRRIRIHTRIPVVLPERIDPSLLDIIATCPLPVIIVIHCNHAAEIDESVAEAVTSLKQNGAILLNQSVLLNGVNDSTDALVNLSERLFEIGILPYYLHQLDPVAGAAHFKVSDTRAVKLIDAVASRLPGYLVPRLVQEIPGETAKKPLHGRFSG